ncbi:MAG: metal-dependent hydrolase [Bacilli bacterium]|nr:metal-dependent hydrolase [Bacilli bacterium]
MKGRTHMVSGVALGYLAFNSMEILNVNLNDSKTLLLVTGGLVLGSLLPDIDHPRSMISLRVKPIGFIVSKLFKHREYTHSIIGSLSMTFLIGILLNLLNIETNINFIFLKALFSGIASHIILDMLTFHGVALLYPFTKKRIRLLGNLYIPRTLEWGLWEIIISLVSVGVIYNFVM